MVFVLSLDMVSVPRNRQSFTSRSINSYVTRWLNRSQPLIKIFYGILRSLHLFSIKQEIEYWNHVFISEIPRKIIFDILFTSDPRIFSVFCQVHDWIKAESHWCNKTLCVKHPCDQECSQAPWHPWAGQHSDTPSSKASLRSHNEIVDEMDLLW